MREHPLDWIWQNSEAFQKFRGEAWMPEPCRSCDRRKEDFGGCRCQAYLLMGDASATDPVCELAPLHQLIGDAVRAKYCDRSYSESRRGSFPRSTRNSTWIFEAVPGQTRRVAGNVESEPQHRPPRSPS